MIVTDAITLLNSSELKTVHLKNNPIDILGFINFGILEIHKRFLLWEAEAIVTIVDGTLVYTLDENDTNVSIDLSDNVIMMLECIEDEDDENITINQKNDDLTVTTPKINQIKISPDLEATTLTVSYRAAPIFLTAETQTIPLPVQFLDALFLYVGYKGSLSVKPGLKDENNAFYVRFQAECDKIKQNGLFTPDDMSSDNYEQRGFV